MPDGDFRKALLGAARRNKSWICVGLDPDPGKFPEGFSRTPTGALSFLRDIVIATKNHVCAYKPNIAFF